MANKQVNSLSSSTPTIDDLTISYDNADTSELKQTTWGLIKDLFATYFPLRANNLSDLSSASTARTNLGLGTLATQNGTSPSGAIVGTTDTQTLTNKTLTTPVISAISNVGTLTLPTSTDTLVGRATTDTLTNKTLTTPNIASIKGTLTTDTDGTTITFDKNTSDFHNVVLGGNRTLALSNMAAGDRIVLRLTQDGTGSRTVTWFSGISWQGGTTPTLTTTINKADMFGFLCTSSGNYDGFVIGQNI